MRRKGRAQAAVLRLVPRSELLDSAEHTAVEHQEADLLWAAIAALPQRQRQVLVLRYYLDQTEAEIAAHPGRVHRLGQEAREPRDRRARSRVGCAVMDTQQVERELTALLHQRAETAMSRTQHPAGAPHVPVRGRRPAADGPSSLGAGRCCGCCRGARRRGSALALRPGGGQEVAGSGRARMRSTPPTWRPPRESLLPGRLTTRICWRATSIRSCRRRLRSDRESSIVTRPGAWST